jgi:hypothetical protein
MLPNLLNYLCEPLFKAPLQLVDAVTTADGTIQSGMLVTPSGKHYPSPTASLFCELRADR